MFSSSDNTLITNIAVQFSTRVYTCTILINMFYWGWGGGYCHANISINAYLYIHIFLPRWAKNSSWEVQRSEDIQEESESEEDSSEDESDAQYNHDISSESSELIKALNVDEWVAVLYEDNWYPGIVQDVISFNFLFYS